MSFDFSNISSLFEDDMKQQTETNEVITPQQTAVKEQKEIIITEQKPDISAISNTLKTIEGELNQLFVERKEIIHVSMISIVAGTHVLLLGPPGTGKSALVQELCSRIENTKYFQWLLNKTSDPSEILGMFSIKEMERDHFKRITTGKLPEAHIAFLDEIYKSNEPTLNILLSLLNERIFYNDGKACQVPLISLFGASNEGPEEDSLMALHDRLLTRINVQYIQNSSNKRLMHSSFLAKRSGELDLLQKTTISLHELKTLQDLAMKVKIPKKVMDEYVKLIERLTKSNQIPISDRRANECLRLMQGSAAYNGRNVIAYEDFRLLKWALWEKEGDIDLIDAMVEKFADPYTTQYKQIETTFTKIKEEIDGTKDTSEKSKKALERKTSIERQIAKLNKIITEAQNSGFDISVFTKFRNEMTEYVNNILNDVFNLTDEL